MLYLIYSDVSAAVFMFICVMKAITISICVVSLSYCSLSDVDAKQSHSQLSDPQNDHGLCAERHQL